jgi:hypothetical protein
MIICTGPPTQVAVERIRGIQVPGRQLSGRKIVDLQTGQGDPSMTLNVIEAQIQVTRLRRVTRSTPPAAVAVSIWPRAGRVTSTIITFDDMPENLADWEGIERGDY